MSIRHGVGGGWWLIPPFQCTSDQWSLIGGEAWAAAAKLVILTTSTHLRFYTHSAMESTSLAWAGRPRSGHGSRVQWAVGPIGGEINLTAACSWMQASGGVTAISWTSGEGNPELPSILSTMVQSCVAVSKWNSDARRGLRQRVETRKRKVTMEAFGWLQAACLAYVMCVAVWVLIQFCMGCHFLIFCGLFKNYFQVWVKYGPIKSIPLDKLPFRRCFWFSHNSSHAYRLCH